MKVLVISDTHRNIANVIKVIKMIGEDRLDVLLHCGDQIEDAERLMNLFPSIETYYVYGNCDGMSYGEDMQKLVYIGGVPIFFTHGHRHNIKSGDYEELWIDAKAHEAKIAICGHSHCAYFQKKEDIIMLNPGSISLPRDTHYPSYGVLEIDEKSKRLKEVSVVQMLDNQLFRQHPCMKMHYF